uniref:Uncharacterized protein n=1 Tax=Rhipicephalus zambeziensis TaxID=60191 RepID=A0A224Y5L5_9ACAR
MVLEIGSPRGCTAAGRSGIPVVVVAQPLLVVPQCRRCCHHPLREQAHVPPMQCCAELRTQLCTTLHYADGGCSIGVVEQGPVMLQSAEPALYDPGAPLHTTVHGGVGLVAAPRGATSWSSGHVVSTTTVPTDSRSLQASIHQAAVMNPGSRRELLCHTHVT